MLKRRKLNISNSIKEIKDQKICSQNSGNNQKLEKIKVLNEEKSSVENKIVLLQKRLKKFSHLLEQFKEVNKQLDSTLY